MIHRAVGHDALELLSNQVSYGVIGCDSVGRVSLFNHLAEQVLGYSASEVIGMSWREAFSSCAVWKELQPLLGQVMNGASFVMGKVTLAGETAIPLMVMRTSDAVHTQTGEMAVFRQMEEPDEMRHLLHNLKTPITAAKSFIDLARSDEVGEEKRGVFLRRAQRSLDTMFSMVSELLDIAWLGSDGQLHCATTDLNEVVDNCVRQMDGFAEHSNLTLACEFSPEPCWVCADDRRLMGVVMNLISNAIKYSPERSEVRVIVDIDGDHARLRVSDQGIGIAPEHMDHIWEPHFRVPTSSNRRIEGSGLGLNLVKTVIDKHGGEVFVTSVPGEGSTFGFWLALEPAG